jgi:hypothetical protein
MTNEKFSMTNFQFRLSALGRGSAAPRLGVHALCFPASFWGTQSDDFARQAGRENGKSTNGSGGF